MFEKRVGMDESEAERERCVKVEPSKVSGWRQRGKDDNCFVQRVKLTTLDTFLGNLNMCHFLLTFSQLIII